jgi:hypothetical protein
VSDFADDIPLDLARAAHAGTSFVPETRGDQERERYAATLAADLASLAKSATTDEKRAVLETEFTRYREGYRKRALAHLSSKSRCVSTMITGASNFPVRQIEKRNAVERARLTDLIDFRARALAAIRKSLHPEWRPIMAGDADASERLREKIAKAEALVERMKAANAAIRKHAKAEPAAQVAALMELGFSAGIAEQLLKPDSVYGMGFPSHKITNNGAEIRRLKSRLSKVVRVSAQEATEIAGELARFEDVPAANRVRLFFPGKPSAEVLERLKGGGFRWTPSVGCWQAYRHQHTVDLAKREAGVKDEARAALRQAVGQ